MCFQIEIIIPARVPKNILERLDGVLAKDERFTNWSRVGWTVVNHDIFNERIVDLYDRETNVGGVALDSGMSDIKQVYFDVGSRHLVLMTGPAKNMDMLKDVCCVVFVFESHDPCLFVRQSFDPTNRSPYQKYLIQCPRVDPIKQLTAEPRKGSMLKVVRYHCVDRNPVCWARVCCRRVRQRMCLVDFEEYWDDNEAE